LSVQDERKKETFHFDRHTPEYRLQFEQITEEMQAKCPVAWTDTYNGHWVAADSKHVFELARCPVVSNHHDVSGETPFQGITIPKASRASAVRGGILEMDEPEHSTYRGALNPYLSPAAIKRWEPFVDEITRAALDEHIESGRIDFVEHLANVVPAVFTLAMMGIELKKWNVYSEPTHASVYTPEHAPEREKINEQHRAMGIDIINNMMEIRQNPRPGLVNAMLQLRINGEPAPDMEILGNLGLIIGGGFGWVAHRARVQRATLLNPATEEFLRFFTPAPGDGRTFADDVEVEGHQFKRYERLWLSWAMANRDPAVFERPNELIMDRKGNRHFSFGIGVHRCVGSNVARTVFKSMLTAVLDRMPDYICDPEGTVHYDSIGVIQGMRNLPAEFTPGRRLGPGLDETLEKLQRICDEQELARPITERKEAAVI